MYESGWLARAPRERYLEAQAYDMPTETLTCDELVELVTDYLEGALRPAEQARFEAHLGRCKHCWNYLEQMRTTIRLTGRTISELLSPAAQTELLAHFQDWNRQQ